LIFISIENCEFIALDREVAHALENFFGEVRMDSENIRDFPKQQLFLKNSELVLK
jgi:hypothetical protein